MEHQALPWDWVKLPGCDMVWFQHGAVLKKTNSFLGIGVNLPKGNLGSWKRRPQPLTNFDVGNCTNKGRKTQKTRHMSNIPATHRYSTSACSTHISSSKRSGTHLQHWSFLPLTTFNFKFHCLGSLHSSAITHLVYQNSRCERSNISTEQTILDSLENKRTTS